VVPFVLLRLPQIDQQEISLHANRQLLGLDGDRGEVGGLTARVLFGFVPLVD
jgi:hypothetical protein